MTQKKIFNKGAILNIIIIVLCVILFGLIIIYTAIYMDYNRTYVNDEHYMLYRVYDNEYNDLMESVYQNEISGASIEGSMAQLYAVAHYYENAVLYYAHQTAGNAAQADMRYEKMQEYAKDMGEFADEAEVILEYLEEINKF